MTLPPEALLPNNPPNSPKDKNSLWGGLNIQKKELGVKGRLAGKVSREG
jgi:hypothetical protein